MVGFRVRRGTAKTVLGISPAELEAAPVSVGTLWGRHGREIENRLTEFRTPMAQAALLARFIAGRVADDSGLDNVVRAAVNLIDHAPCNAIRSLVGDIGLSERHLRRRFQDHVGLGIKHYARIIRFQRLLDATRQHTRRFGLVSPGWAAIAYDHGFSDQAHLIREIRAFAGLTPAELLQAV